jgi:hypothetical protein
MKLWVDKEYHLKRRLEMPQSEPVDYTYRRLNAVPDSEFQIPEDFEILSQPAGPGPN